MTTRSYALKLGMSLLAASLAFAAGCSSSGGNAGLNHTNSPSPPAASTASPVGESSPAPTVPSASSEPTPSSPAVVAPEGQPTALRLADEKIGWAGGKGWIARTDDGGRSWSVQYSKPFEVVQLFALNDVRIWATLDTGSAEGLRLVRSNDGGKSWNEAGVVPNRGYLHFRNDKDGFAGNAFTKDGGETWSVLKTPDSLVGDAYFHDLNNGWAVRRSKGKFEFLHSADGGQSWKTVMSRKWDGELTDAIIRSTGKNDAWIELIGESGMTQTSYSVFHTFNGGGTWTSVLAKSNAGSGPAPGFEMDGKEEKASEGPGNSPGVLYVVNPQTAIMGGQCLACDAPNTIAETTDGGKSWTVSKREFSGYGRQLIAAVDAKRIWLLTTDSTEPSVLYVTSDGGKNWDKTYSFAASD